MPGGGKPPPDRGGGTGREGRQQAPSKLVPTSQNKGTLDHQGQIGGTTQQEQHPTSQGQVPTQGGSTDPQQITQTPPSGQNPEGKTETQGQGGSGQQPQGTSKGVHTGDQPQRDPRTNPEDPQFLDQMKNSGLLDNVDPELKMGKQNRSEAAKQALTIAYQRSRWYFNTQKEKPGPQLPKLFNSEKEKQSFFGHPYQPAQGRLSPASMGNFEAARVDHSVYALYPDVPIQRVTDAQKSHEFFMGPFQLSFYSSKGENGKCVLNTHCFYQRSHPEVFKTKYNLDKAVIDPPLLRTMDLGRDLVVWAVGAFYEWIEQREVYTFLFQPRIEHLAQLLCCLVPYVRQLITEVNNREVPGSEALKLKTNAAPTKFKKSFEAVKEELCHLLAIRLKWIETTRPYRYEQEVAFDLKCYVRGQKELFDMPDKMVIDEPQPSEPAQDFVTVFGQNKNSVGMQPIGWTPETNQTYPPLEQMLRSRAAIYSDEQGMTQVGQVLRSAQTLAKAPKTTLEQYADLWMLLSGLDQMPPNKNNEALFAAFFENKLKVSIGDYTLPSVEEYVVGKPPLPTSLPGFTMPQQTKEDQKEDPNAQPQSTSRLMGWDPQGYKLLSGTKPITNLGLQAAYAFLTNCLYLGGTIEATPSNQYTQDLTSQEGAKLTQCAYIISQFVISRQREQPLTLLSSGQESIQNLQAEKPKDDSEELARLMQALEDDYADDVITSEEYEQRREEITKGEAKQDTPMATEPAKKDAFDMSDLIKLIEGGQEAEIFKLDTSDLMELTYDETILALIYKYSQALVTYYLPSYTRGKMGRFEAYLGERLNANKPRQLQTLEKFQSYIRDKLPILTKNEDVTNPEIMKKYERSVLIAVLHGVTDLGVYFHPTGPTAQIEEAMQVAVEVLVAGVRGRSTTVPKPWVAHAKKESKAKGKKVHFADEPAPQSALQPTQQGVGKMFDFGIKRVFDRIPLRTPIVTVSEYFSPINIPSCGVFWDSGQQHNPVYDYFYQTQVFRRFKIIKPGDTYTKIVQGVPQKIPIKLATAYGVQVYHHFEKIPDRGRGEVLHEQNQNRTQSLLQTTKFLLNTPIFEFASICHDGYVQLSTEVDYMVFQKPKTVLKNNIEQMVTALHATIEQHQSKTLAYFISIDGNTYKKYTPAFDEGHMHRLGCHDLRGQYNLPEYVERDIKKVSKTHVRHLIVRSAIDGSRHPTGYAFCPNVEVCKIVAENIVRHLNIGPLTPWQGEVCPEKKPSGIVFPEALHQLPPALYEYIVGYSGPCSHLNTFELQSFWLGPQKYWGGTTQCLGYIGSMTKGDMLYGLTLDQISLKPRFLLRYMNTKITTNLYFYDFKSAGLISPWATPSNMNILRAISALPSSYDKKQLLLLNEVSMYKSLCALLVASGYTLDGQAINQQRYDTNQKLLNSGQRSDISELLESSSLGTLQQWAVLFSNTPIQEASCYQDQLLVIPPDVAYMRFQLGIMPGSETITNGHYLNAYIGSASSESLIRVFLTASSIRCRKDLVPASLQPGALRNYYFGFKWFQLWTNRYRKWHQLLGQTLNTSEMTMETNIYLGRAAYDPPSLVHNQTFWKCVNPAIDTWDIRYGMAESSLSLDKHFARTIRAYCSRITEPKKENPKGKKPKAKPPKKEDSDEDSDKSEVDYVDDDDDDDEPDTGSGPTEDNEDDDKPSKRSRPISPAGTKKEQPSQKKTKSSYARAVQAKQEGSSQAHAQQSTPQIKRGPPPPRTKTPRGGTQPRKPKGHQRPQSSKKQQPEIDLTKAKPVPLP